SEHAIDDHGSFEQVAAVFGEDGALGRFADRMTGAADPLDAAGDAGRRLNLDDEVDRTHVDTQLEARGRNQSGEAARLERILDQEALLLGDRAVVGTNQLLTREPIDRRGQSFGKS